MVICQYDITLEIKYEKLKSKMTNKNVKIKKDRTQINADF